MCENHVIFPSISYCGKDAIDWVHVIFYDESQIHEMIRNLEALLNENMPDSHFHIQSVENNPNLKNKDENPDIPEFVKNEEFIEIIFCGPRFYQTSWNDSVKRLTYNYLQEHTHNALCSLVQKNNDKTKYAKSLPTFRKRRRFRYSTLSRSNVKTIRHFRKLGKRRK